MKLSIITITLKIFYKQHLSEKLELYGKPLNKQLFNAFSIICPLYLDMLIYVHM